MKVRDVMTKHLISILPDVHVREAARMMAGNGISALTVVDARGSLVGILSEGDLLHRRELNTETRRSWWLDLFASDRDLAADFVKSHSQKVRDVMTTKVITASPDDALVDIARRFEKHRIKRMPVIENGRLIGIVYNDSERDAIRVTAENTPGVGAVANNLRVVSRPIEDG